MQEAACASQDDSRQHSWTAGRPAPKYRPADGLSHTAPGAAQMPRTSLQTLSEEEGTYIQTPSDQSYAQPTGPTFSSYPPLAGPPTHAQPAYQQPATTGDTNLQPAVATARALPLPNQQALPFPPDQQGLGLHDLPPQAVSPFEPMAEMPFTPPQRVQSILTSHHTDRVHFEENPLFVPLDSPDGASYR